MKSALTRLLAIIVLLALVVTPVAAQVPTPGLETYKFQPVDKFEPTEAELAWVAEVQKVDGFIIQLEEPSLATYKGGISGYSAPERTDSGKLEVSSDSSIAYVKHLRQQIDAAIVSSEKIVGRDLEVYARFEVVLNGFAAKMTAQEAAALRNMPGVREVYPDQIWYPDTDTSPEFLGVDGIWDGTNVAGGVTAKGEGVLVGILDTGINMDHPSFAEVGPVDGYVHTNPFGPDTFKGLCVTDPTNYVCNDKLVGVYAYTTEPIRGEDSEDHGSHTASTTAGNVVQFSFSGAPVTISGMAPHANIIAFDVCDANGCANSATVSAVGQAITDGVDVLNYSIGPSSGPGQSPYVSASEVAFLEAVDAGIITATSAGNSGPNSYTTYKAAPWTLIVANTNHGRIFGNPVIVNPGDATEYSAIGLPDAGPALLEDLTDVPFKWGGLDSAAYDIACTALPVDYFKDTVALLTRGTCSFDTKITNAQNAGALAVVVRNNAPGAPIVMGLNTPPLPPTTVTIPAVMVSKDDGDAMVALAAAGMTVTLEADYGSQNELEWGDVLNQSSSRGPFTLADVLVPEIAAPGTNVLAAYDSQEPGTEYGLMSGTSMASPHAAGSLALLTELFPTWSPAARKSALMLTALPDTTKDYDFGPVNAFDYGNGRLDMNMAALTGLVMDETYDGFVAADPDTGGDIKTVNIPSYQNTYCVGVCSFERTFTSVADVSATYTLDLEADVDLVVDVQPTTFTIEPGATQTITVEIDSNAAESEVWVFGRIGYTTTDTWTTGEEISDVALPFAVRPFPSNMPEFVEEETLRDQGATVVTDIQSKAISEFTAVKSGLVPGTDTELTVIPDATNLDPFDDLSQVWWKTFTLSEPADRLVMEILDTTAGDLDMFFGVGTVPDPDEVYAQSATGAALEYISITGIPAGLPLWVLIQNYDGDAAGDMVKYTEAVIYPEDAGNWDVTGPTSVEALEPYDVTISWNIPDMPTPSAWYGMFSILASPEATDPISTTEFNLYRTGDDVEKSVNVDYARKDEVITYEIQINPNYSDTDLTYTIEDVLPAEVEYVDGSLEVIGSDTLATYDPATRTVSWVGVSPAVEFNYLISDNLTDPNCVMPISNGYLDLLGVFGYTTDPDISGDGAAWQYTTLGADTSWFDGRTSEPPIFVDDGHAYMNGSYTNDNYWYYETQEFPNPLAPNDVMAAFMTDIVIVYDEATNKGVTAVTLGSGAAWVVEYDDVENYYDSETTMDVEFFGWTDADPALSGADIMFAYDNVQGDWSGYNTIGLENGDGTIGATYQYDGPNPTNGLVVCFDYASTGDEPIIIRFDATVVTDEVGLAVVNSASHDNDALNTEPEMALAEFNIIPLDPTINEFSARTTGTDVEFVEFFGSPNLDYSAYTFLVIEGDGSTSENIEGYVDNVITLGTTDANGLYLVNLEANTVENGTISFLLVSGNTAVVGDDLDTNDDGVLDSEPWAEIVDSVAVHDGGSSDLTYTTPVLGVAYDGLPFAPGGASRIPDGFDTDAATDWVRNDFDLAGISGFAGTPIYGEAYNTPGEFNEIVPNTPPVAALDAYSTDEDTNLMVLEAEGVLDNDTDVDGQTLTAELVADVTDGLLELAADGSFVYTPAENFFGTESFTYKANDGLDDSNIATVTITVIPVNDAPVAQYKSVTTPEDTALLITLVASDVDDDALTYAIVAHPAHGTVTLAGNVAKYTPALDYYGTDSFTYKANDGELDSNFAKVSITVTAVNEAPVAVADAYTMNEDEVLTVGVEDGILANDTDVENDDLTSVLVDDVSHGTLALAEDGSFVYTPAENFFGTDSFTYKANDGLDDSNIATVTITVTAVNDAPVAVNDEYTMAEKETLTIAAPGVLGNDSDVDGDTLNAILVDTVSNGSLTLNADGSFIYTPNEYFNGTDSFTYKANDGLADSELAVVTIKVTARQIFLPLILK